MNIFSLPAAIAFTLNFSIAMLVLLDRPGETLNRWFSGFVFMFAIWNLAEIILLNSVHYEKALFGAQILYRALFLTPAIFLIIARMFPRPGRHNHFKPWAQILILALPIIILASSFPDFSIYPVPLANYPNIYYYHIKVSSDFSVILLVILSMFYIIWGSYLLIRKLGKARTNQERTRIKFLLGGILIIFLGYIIINLFPLHGERVFSFYFFSTLLTLFISLFFFAAIMQFKLFRLSRLITGSLTYTILSSIILTIYFLVIKGLSNSLGKLFHIYSFFFEALLILLLIFLIRPLEVRIEKLIDRLLYKNIYHYRKNFLVFSHNLLKYFSTDKFFHEVSEFLKKNFFVDDVLIYSKNENEDIYQLWNMKQGNNMTSFSTHDYLPGYLARHKKAIEFYDMDHQKFTENQLRFLTDSHVSLILPLFYENELVSFILLPEKNNKKSFPQEEIEILTIFSNEVANALARNRTIEKIKEEERERSRMERLAALGQLTAGVAHEIRNPLNTISTSAETLLHKKLKPEDEKQLKGFILEEIRRLNHILTDFLKMSRIRKIQLQESNIDDFLQEISYEVSQRINQKTIFKIENLLQSKKLIMDKKLMYQVILNLIINALDAIRVRQEKEAGYQGMLSLRIEGNKQTTRFIITDDGIPIAPENKERIFDPFFTTKKDGTGLGLSICGNLIKSMGGNLSLEMKGPLKRFIIELHGLQP